MRIKKVSGTAVLNGNVVDDVFGNSTENASSQNSINNVLTYSTEERRVGTWKNGKPLYETTISYANSITGSTEIEHGIADVEEIWVDIANSYLKKSTGNTAPTSYYANSSDYGATFVNTTMLLFPGANFVNISSGNFSLRYTKTTD